MPFDLKGPAFQCGFAFPEQFFVAMNVATVNVVFRCVITKQTQIERICSARQEFKGSKISLIEWSGVGPDPANAIFFQEPNELWPMADGVTELKRQPENSPQFRKKPGNRRFAILWGRRRREPDEG